jgi:hypothetical protein
MRTWCAHADISERERICKRGWNRDIGCPRQTGRKGHRFSRYASRAEQTPSSPPLIDANFHPMSVLPGTLFSYPLPHDGATKPQGGSFP